MAAFSLAGNAASAQPTRTVAVTFDDVPIAGSSAPCDPAAAQAFTARLLAAIAAEAMPAAAFVNEGRVCSEHRDEILIRMLGAWADAGHALGNHTATHPDLNRTPLAVYLADIDAGARVTREVLSSRDRELEYFRHPQLHTGPNEQIRDAVAAHLTAQGYRLAPVMIDNQEWVFAAAYAAAGQRGDAAAQDRILDAYMPYMDSVFAFFEQRSRDVLGYEPPQILLLHANELNIEALPALAAMMRARGYDFITLEGALRDPAYASPDAYAGPRGLSWIHRWGLARGLPVEEEPREPEWVAALVE
ncbi:MAG: polysaccharide deacetylase family protein [Hyphomonadaceae bacterium]